MAFRHEVSIIFNSTSWPEYEVQNIYHQLNSDCPIFRGKNQLRSAACLEFHSIWTLSYSALSRCSRIPWGILPGLSWMAALVPQGCGGKVNQLHLSDPPPSCCKTRLSYKLERVAPRSTTSPHIQLFRAKINSQFSPNIYKSFPTLHYQCLLNILEK